MIFENYSFVLTSKGFQDIRDLINEENKDKTKIAYITSEGKLDFTNEYIVEKSTPKNIVEYTDDLFLSFISNSDAEFYSSSVNTLDRIEFIKTNIHNAKNILTCYDCFKNADVQDISSDIMFNDGTCVTISYKNLIKLFILFCAFGSFDIKSDSPSIRLYTNFKGDFYKLYNILSNILGKDNVKYFKSEAKSTFYIDSKYLYNYFTQNDLRNNMMENMICHSRIENSSYLICQAVVELTDELKYYDARFNGYNVLLGGRNLTYISSYLQACLSVCGYKSYFRRQANGKFKLMFTKQELHYFIDNIKYSENKNKDFYIIKTKERLPVFILEVRNHLHTVNIRPTYIIENNPNVFKCSYNILGDD